MTNIWDTLITHQGWAAPNFQAGGWQDLSIPLFTGLQARSWWASSVNGQPIDMAAAFAEGSNVPTSPYWFNVHTVGPRQGLTIPSPYLVTPNTRLYTYTRVPRSDLAINWRIIVSDVGTTPPPNTPP